MFYAIEYAYGRNIVNNGNRSDRVLEFSAKRLRNAWVDAGDPNVNSSGYRETLTAHDSRVRGNDWLEDGDSDAWHVMAEGRIEQSSALNDHRIMLRWFEGKDHWKWVATAPEREIVRWAIDTEKNVEELEV